MARNEEPHKSQFHEDLPAAATLEVTVKTNETVSHPDGGWGNAGTQPEHRSGAEAGTGQPEVALSCSSLLLWPGKRKIPVRRTQQFRENLNETDSPNLIG